MATIKEVFAQFCKERHAEDKGRNYDLLQHVYAHTEFFDTTLYKITGVPLNFEQRDSKTYIATFPIEDFSIPFQNNFIKIDEKICLFLREYAPNILTGTLYTINYLGQGNTLNIPFTIRLYETEGVIISDFYEPLLKDRTERILKDTFVMVIGELLALNELSKKAIAVDKPTESKCEYYRRKKAPTIKIPQRPIYYILGEKNEDVSPKYKYIQTTGHLEYSFCFSVRGHWRRVGEKTLGKDRNGNYNVHGFTWVTEYTKGEGELAKRIRVIE